MRDFFECFGPVILFAVISFGGLMLGANGWEQYTCNNYERVTGKETKWVFMDECYVSTTVGWQRWDEYKDRAIASEGLKHVP